MATTSSTTISRADYLKKYLSTNENKPKKKKTKKLVSSGMRIIEEDTFTQTLPDNYKHEGGNKQRLKGIKHEGVSSTSVSKWIKVGSDLDDEENLPNTTQKLKIPHSSTKKIPTKSVKEEIVSDNEQSSFAKKKSNSLSRDNSPIRPRRKPRVGDVGENSSSDDNSPIRKTQRRRRSLSSDNSPPRRNSRNKKESSSSRDNSPIRRRQIIKDEEDVSPPRRPRPAHSKYSNNQRNMSSTSSGDNSPIRQQQNKKNPISDGDASPSKRRRFTQQDEDNVEIDRGYAKKRVTLFNKNRRRRVGVDEDDVDPERKEREARKQEELERKYQSWSKGVSQINERKDKLKEMEETIQEGFSRYADDKSMNKHLQDQLLEDDPMAEYFMTKTQKIKMQTGIVYPTYKGQFPPNRFGIAPGYRWDGVNRSNGFESKMAITINKRRAEKNDAYRSIAECAE